MIPAFAIHCPELPAFRRDVSDTHYRERGITPTWWRSPHGVSWGLQTSKRWEQDNCTIHPKYVALTLGHWHLWQHIYHVGHTEALILEDDAILCDDFARKLTALRDSLPADWGFCFAGTVATVDAPARVFTHHGAGLVRTSWPYGMHCYLVHRPALPVLLDAMAEVRGPIDLQLWENVLRPGNLSWYIAAPSLAAQRDWEKSV